MLRVLPQPVTRMRPMDEESEAPSSDTGEEPGAATGTPIDFGFGLRKFIGTARVMASGAQ